MFKPTSKVLIKKAQDLGVALDEAKVLSTLNKTLPRNSQYTNWELTRLISNKNLLLQFGSKKAIPKTLFARNQLQSAMLCARYTEQKEDFQNFLLSDESPYVAEEKLNGNRCLMFYTPAEGFKLYSNNRDTQTLLPEDNTARVIWNPESFKGKLPVSFILDCEIICPSKSIDTTYRGGVVMDSELSSVNVLLGLPPEESKHIQRTQENAELQFYIFDMPFYKQNLTAKPFYERRASMEKLVKHLIKTYKLPFHIPALHRTDKKYFFESLVDTMKEGIVLKNINGDYTFDETRSRGRQVKLKRSLRMQTGEDIDGFIIGHVPATKGKRNENYIGGFQIGTILRGFAGDRQHHVATITTLPDNLRKEATVYDDKGEPQLNPDFLYRVLSFDGFDVKQKSLRFSHARVESWDTCWRPDKSFMNCVLSEDFLLEQAL